MSTIIKDTNKVLVKLNYAMKRTILSLIIFVFIYTSCKQSGNRSKQSPNVILILADDLGYDDIGLHGNSVIETPNLNKLGKQSVRFDNFHVSSVSAPTRAALLTGRNFLRTGVSGVHAGRDYINLDETLISEVFQQNGYKTGMWGKWHSGKANGYFPWDRGFDEAYYSLLYNYFDNTGLFNGKHVQQKGFTTNAITDMALQFIEKNKDEPFFAYIPHLAPHNPWRAPEQNIQKYIDKGLSAPMATLYGMIDNLDFNIGRVIDKVHELDIADNTIIIFLSDNGPNRNSYRFGLTAEEWEQRNVNGFRGQKGNNWQNGIKSPLFVYYPDKFDANKVLDFVKVEDLFPTLLKLANIPIPENLKLDGQSLIPALNGNALPKDPVFVSHFSPKGDTSFNNLLDKWGNNIPLSKEFKSTFKPENQRLALLKQPYKYLQNEKDGQAEVYDIINNPQEKDRQIIENDSLTNSIKTELHSWFNEILASNSFAMPTFQIGYNKRKFSQVFAYAPIETSATIMNMDLYSANWQKKGDFAKYKINVVTPGKYEIFLIHKIAKFGDLTFKASTENAQISSQLTDSGSREFGTMLEGESAYWENFDHINTFKKDIIKSSLGTLQLNNDDKLLTLEIEQAIENHQGQATDQFISIQLVMVD